MLRDTLRTFVDGVSDRARGAGLAPIADGIHSMRRAFYTTRRVAPKVMYGLVDRGVDNEKLMINVGGGYFVRRHWRVMDYPSSWYAGLDPYIDYKVDLWSDAQWPLRTDSVSFFFTSHTLEHIPHEFCGHLLREFWRCLKVGGALRIVVPDYDLAYDAYAANDMAFFEKYAGDTIADRFLDYVVTSQRGKMAPEKLHADFLALDRLALAEKLTGEVDRATQRACFGNHINWWNYDKTAAMLREAGFETVYRSTAQGSRFPEMRGEGRETGFDSTHPELSLFVEAVK